MYNQGGHTSFDGATYVDVNFPVKFENKVLLVVLSDVVASTVKKFDKTTSLAWNVEPTTTNQFRAVCYENLDAFRYLAIGF